jgi:lysophospholipase L1-like esterase
MKRDLRHALLFALALAGCEIGSAPLVPPNELDVGGDASPDVIASPDLPSSPDVPASPDVPRGPDASAQPDATSPVDVIAPLDVVTPSDVPADLASPDAPSPLDVVTPPDVPVDRASPPDVVTPPDVPADRASPPDVVTPPDVPSTPDTTTMVPTFDAATIAHVREVRTRGVARGMRLNVFAKIGDSITESASFLSDIGFGWYELGSWTSLEPTVRYFSTQTITGSANSFNRASVCAMGGWVSQYALSGDPDSALRRELDATRPAYAMVMYGTNDLDRYSTAVFRTNMERIVDIIEANGTVATISTIPDRLDRPDAGALVPMFNQTIRDIAAARHLPLMDYWAALQPLPRRGVDTDGIHPSPYVTASGGTACGVLTTAGLRAGYNMRNLVALVLLDRLRNLP